MIGRRRNPAEIRTSARGSPGATRRRRRPTAGTRAGPALVRVAGAP